MKWMVPMLTLLIFLVQIHCIYYSTSSHEKMDISINIAKTTPAQPIICNDNTEKIYTTIVNIIIKCSLAFLGGVLISDGKFLRFGVI